MNDILKQRLVGALILVALGVVFWPIIFVEPGDISRDERAGIPPRPAVDTRPMVSPDMVGLRPSPEIEARQDPPAQEAAAQPQREPGDASADESTVDSVEPSPAAVVQEATPAEQEASRTRSEAPERPTLDADGLPVAWILQVASVSSPEKADELRRSLLEMDQKAYVKKIKRNGRALYRVYIGPKYEKAKLAPVKTRVDSTFGVQSMIVRYYP
jgi:DedD protein